MPGTRGKRRRRQLLEAALEAFSSVGYDRATTREIAESAGVSEAALFKYFPSKRELFMEVLREFGPAELLDVPVDALGELRADEALSRALTRRLDAWWEHRRWLRVLWQEAGRDEEAAEELRSQFRSARKAMRRLLERLGEEGAIRPESAHAATHVVLMAIRGFIAHAAHRARKRGWERVRDHFIESLLEALLRGILP